MRFSPIGHMLAWGFILGGISGGLYILLLFLTVLVIEFDPFSSLWQAMIIFTPFSILGGATIGAMAGLVIGLLNGLFLSLTFSCWQNSFSYSKRLLLDGCSAVVSIFSSFCLLFILLGDAPTLYRAFGILAFLPPVIAGIAATYATHRYFLRYIPDTRKEKLKNEN